MADEPPSENDRKSLDDDETTTNTLIDERDGKITSQTVQYIVEAQVLARALFLRAGDVVEKCDFNNILDQPTATLIQASETASSQICDRLYLPLTNDQCFRVLVVQPGEQDYELKTSLEPAQFGDDRPYEAVSYTWGPPADRTLLRCNKGTVSIPRNLEKLLKRIRHSKKSRIIWADAVCINQNDIAERGQQVSVMRKIFQSACRVLVWLGSDQQRHAEGAFNLVCNIVREWRPEGSKYSFEPYMDLLEPDLHTPTMKLPPLSDQAWVHLKAMFEVEYFNRFWIIQELVVPDSAVVIWGEHHIAWPLVGLCSAWMQTAGWQFLHPQPITASYNPFLIYTLPIARYSGISRFSKLDMAVILSLTRERFVSTDDRDRIFALLGLPFAGNNPESDTLLMTPDYRESVRDIYVRAARSMLRQDQHLRLLSAVQHGQILDASYPSWVPNWSGLQYADPIGLRNEQGYYANAGQLFYPGPDSFGSDGESLFVKGLEYAEIVEVSEEFASHNITLRTLTDRKNKAAMTSIINSLNEPSNQFRASWGTGTDEHYALFMFEDPEYLTQSGARGAVSTGMPGKYSLRQDTETLTGERAQSDNLGEFLMYWRERSSWKNEIQHHDYRSFWRMKSKDAFSMERALSAFNVFPGRRIFHMNNGEYGLGPAAMQPGDVVVVLFGGIVPFVLHPMNQEGGYQLVGECFVPKIMKGKVVANSGLYKEGEICVHNDDVLRREWKEDPRCDPPVGPAGVKQFELR